MMFGKVLFHLEAVYSEIALRQLPMPLAACVYSSYRETIKSAIQCAVLPGL